MALCLDALKNGQIILALQHLTSDAIRHKLKLYFDMDVGDEKDERRMIRNRMQHLALWFGDKKADDTIAPTIYEDINHIVNDLRRLMQYDRKLKNAVSKSVIGILEREKLGLNWRMEGHKLSAPVISSYQARHIKTDDLDENLNTRNFTLMVARLFGGKVDMAADVAMGEMRG